MLADRVIGDGTLRVHDDGWSFEIRIPWYRALPLSCFERLEVALDGREVDPARVAVEINGDLRRMRDLPPLHEEWWYVADPARVHVDEPGAVERQGSHQLDVTVAFRIPYLVTDGVALVMREHCVKDQPVEVAR